MVKTFPNRTQPRAKSMMFSHLRPNSKFLVLAARLLNEYDVNEEVQAIADRMEEIRVLIGKDDVTLQQANTLHAEVERHQARIDELTVMIVGEDFTIFADKLKSNFVDLVHGKVKSWIIPLCDGAIRGDVRSLIVNDTLENPENALIVPALKEFSALAVYASALRENDPSAATLLLVDMADEWIKFAHAMLRALSGHEGVIINKETNLIDAYPGAPSLESFIPLSKTWNIPSLGMLQMNPEWIAEATSCNVFLRNPKSLNTLLTLFSSGCLVNEEIVKIEVQNFDCSDIFNELVRLTNETSFRLSPVQAILEQLICGEHLDTNGVNIIWKQGQAFEDDVHALLDPEIQAGTIPESRVSRLALLLNAIARNTTKMAYHVLSGGKVTKEEILLGILI